MREKATSKRTPNVHEGHRERMRLRFAADNGESMATHELLEMLLFSVIPRCNTNEIAHALLKRFQTLDGVFEASIADLMQIDGIGHNSAVHIKLMSALIRRAEIERRAPVKQFLTEQQVIDYLCPLFLQLNVERIYMLCFDDAGHLLCCEMISEGCVNAVAVNSQLMLRLAVAKNAAWVVLAHNHPHGLACPTMEDRVTTQKYNTLFDCVGIPLVEHFVIANGKAFPMLKKGEKAKEQGSDS